MSEVQSFQRPQKEVVNVNGVDRNFPGQGTAARFVWDLCLKAVEKGLSSTDVIDKALKDTSMSRASVNSQITYFRKETGLELSRRVDTTKAEEKARKAAEREAKRAENAGKAVAKRDETIDKLEKRIAKDTEQLSKLRAEKEAAESKGGEQETAE